MISAVWPMPESYTPVVSKIKDHDVQKAIKFLQQKNDQFNKAFINIPSEEKLKISNTLESIMKQLAAQMIVKSVININNIDLDDSYQQFKQPSLFEGTEFDPNVSSFKDEPF